MRNPPPGDWLMWRRTYDGWGYSTLDQINKDNVKNLRPAWTWSLTSGVTEIAPLVHDGVLFITNAGDKIQALNAATGDLLWEYRRDLPPKLITEGGNSLAKRNMALYGDKLFIATSDAHLVALDAKTGKVVWDHTVADWNKGWRYSSGPFVAGGKVIAGMSGCNAAQGGGCFITGHDPNNGKELWRVHTIAQNGDPNEKTMERAAARCSASAASAWIAGTYDPEQNTVYYGVGQPYPWIADMRGTLVKKDGFDNSALYTDSTLAIDPSTGKLKWYHQHLENDTDDLDYSYERMLVDLPIQWRDAKGVRHGRQARHRGSPRSHERPVPMGERDGARRMSCPRSIRKPAKRRSIRRPFHISARPRWSVRPIRARAAGRRRPTARERRCSIMPLSEFCSNTTPTPLDPGQKYTGGGRAVHSRMPVPNSDGNFGPARRDQDDGPPQAWSTPATRADDQRRAADRRRHGLRRLARSLVPRL